MKFLPALLGLGLLLAAGCATKPKAPAITGDPMVDGRNAIASGPPRDRVLWQYRVGLMAMRRGDYAEAKQHFDDAITRIGGIYTTDADARKARSFFHAEAKKTFIGEPYERVMVYFYRGILYWMDGEPDNARACFRSAQFQDADTEAHTYAADYILLDYLDGFASTKLGSDGSDEFNRAVNNARNGLQIPEYPRKANVLVFIEYGRGPRKFATGPHGQQLRFAEQGAGARSATLRVGTQQYPLPPYDDLQWQATTRGGRVMDHILGNKAVFKDVTAGTAMAAAITAGGLAHHGHEEAALVAGGVAIVAGLLSAFTVPAADTRMWESLPRYLTFATLELPPGEHSFAVDFQNGAHQVISTRTVTLTVPNNATRDTVLFVSEHNT